MRMNRPKTKARPKLIFLLVAAFACLSCGYDGPRFDVADLKAKLDAAPDAILVLDVRPRRQFDAGHIQGALNIPLEELDGRVAEIASAKKTVAVVCTCGRRSLEAVKKLRTRGLDPILLLGGMKEWKKAGYPEERTKAALPVTDSSAVLEKEGINR